MHEVAVETVVEHEGRNVNRDQVNGIATPLGTATWRPISHYDAIETTLAELEKLGITVTREQHTLANKGQEYFGVFRLGGKAEAAKDWELMLGLRNSHTKRFALRFGFGAEVFICSNGAFAAEVNVIRKHTSLIYHDLPTLVHGALEKVAPFREIMVKRQRIYEQVSLADNYEKDAYALGAVLVQKGILPGSKLRAILDEWDEPTFEAFKPRNLWSFYNSITHVLKDEAPALLARRTQQLTQGTDGLAQFLGKRQMMEKEIEKMAAHVMSEVEAGEQGDQKRVGFQLPGLDKPKFGPPGDPGLN